MIGYIKRLLPSTLFGRSLLILVTPLLLVQVVTTYMFFDRHWEKMTGRLTFAVAGEIAVLADLVEQNSNPDNISVIAERANEDLDMTLSYFENSPLTRVSQEDEFTTLMGRMLYRSIAAQVARPAEINIEREEKWVEVNVQLEEGTMSVLLPQRRLFSSSGYIVLLWMIGTSVIMLAIAILFMRNQIRPIRRLAIAAERLGKGRDVPFFKAEGAREVRQAARAFMDMRARIDRQIAQRTAMLAGVSHDLRTPLTRITLQAEMMPAGPDKDDLKSDIAEMQRMIDAYLQFARGEGQEESQRIDVGALVNHMANAAKRNGARISVESEEGITLMLRPVAMERCLGNLIGNAVKYAQEVWVRVERREENVAIIIDDDGPGIRPEQREDMFKPFVRGEQSRNVKTGGVGLGLPIAQDIVHSHGGEIALLDSPRGGLRVEVILPV